MATFQVVSSKAVSVTTEFRNFPLTFVNGVRRITLSDIPTVLIRDVQILDNTTQMPHEMLKHRMELLPVKVAHTDTQIIKDAVVELRVLPQPENAVLTTDDFVIHSGREHILMRDRDLDTPLLFLRVRKGESVHVKGKLAVEKGSQVCTTSMSYHIDPEIAAINRKRYVEEGNDVRVFDNFYIQKSYSRDKNGRPNWIDMNVETVGVLPPKEIMKLAIEEFKNQVDDWTEKALERIAREKEENVYNIQLEQGGHTVGALIQELIYHSGDASFVSYDIPHPMKSTMIVRFLTMKKPELLLKEIHKTFHEYCDVVEKGL